MHTASVPHARSWQLPRSGRYLRRSSAFAALFFLPLVTAHDRPRAPEALSNIEFWNLFTTMSEPGGSFVSENFVSNEMSFQDVIPTLQRSLTAGGVYLGVGPEQNFTYIANLEPRIAVIFDIRRQNAMQHLMYKALFELAPTRAEFVARLFSRPDVARLGISVKATALFDSADAAAPSDSAYRANHDAIIRTLTTAHGFALSPDDIATIESVYAVFHDAGPAVNYGTRSSAPTIARATYPAFGALQSATNADGIPMAFLATEQNYRRVRDLELRNLVIPVVGDFAGPKAIRSVGEYLRQRGMTVTAFYVSNVEQYLFRQAGAANEFYGNVASLPLDSTSTFIRSIPGTGAFPGLAFSIGPGSVVSGSSSASAGANLIGGFSFSISDSGGVRTIRTVRDSAGVQVVHVTVDSGGRTQTARGDSTRAVATRQDSALSTLRALLATRDSLIRQFPGPTTAALSRQVMMASLLRSGLASMRETLDALFAKRLETYDDVIRMTKSIR